jgi:hypothetical protein
MPQHTNLGFRTEIDFELPKGYVDEAGALHRSGVMRLATAADEILPLRDPRVQQNEAYLTVIVLSRVIVRLGSLGDVHTGIIERMYASDVAYLQRLYDELNFGDGEPRAESPANGAGRAIATSLRRMTAVGEA